MPKFSLKSKYKKATTGLRKVERRQVSADARLLH